MRALLLALVACSSKPAPTCETALVKHRDLCLAVPTKSRLAVVPLETGVRQCLAMRQPECSQEMDALLECWQTGCDCLRYELDVRACGTN
jgi:hypothetical protein